MKAPNSQSNAPVKFYTPKGAARAMMAGKVLHGPGGCTFYFDEDGFFYNDKQGGFRLAAIRLAGLWEEL
jgi:hypothetical protein